MVLRDKITGECRTWPGVKSSCNFNVLCENPQVCRKRRSAFPGVNSRNKLTALRSNSVVISRNNGINCAEQPNLFDRNNGFVRPSSNPLPGPAIYRMPDGRCAPSSPSRLASTSSTVMKRTQAMVSHPRVRWHGAQPTGCISGLTLDWFGRQS